MIEDLNPPANPIPQQNPLPPPKPQPVQASTPVLPLSQQKTSPPPPHMYAQPVVYVQGQTSGKGSKAVIAVLVVIIVILAIVLAAMVIKPSGTGQSSGVFDVSFKTAAANGLFYAQRWSQDAELLFAEAQEYSSVKNKAGVNIIVQADSNLGDGRCRLWVFEYYSLQLNSTYMVELLDSSVFTMVSTYYTNPIQINTASIVDSDAAASTALAHGGAGYMKNNTYVNVSYFLSVNSLTNNTEWDITYTTNNGNQLGIIINAKTGAFISKNSGTGQTPAGVFTSTMEISQWNEKITTSQFSPDTSWDDCDIIVENVTQGNFSGLNEYSMIYYSGGTVNCSLMQTPGIPNMFASGFDSNDDGLISSGDYFTLTMVGPGFVSGTSYMVELTYIPTGNIICQTTFNI